MLAHNVRLALKSLRRNPVLTALIVSGIALGICVSTTFSSARHSMARDPIPHKSDVLYYVRLDSWDPARPFPGNGPPAPPYMVTYRDVVELLRSDIPVRQAALFPTTMFVHPAPPAGHAYPEEVRVTTSEFFPMFEVPFLYGSGWDHAAETSAAKVAVIDSKTNQKLFGGVNSVGRELRLGDHDYTVVGVIGEWRPNVRFYDLTNGDRFGPPEGIYIPFSLTVPLELRNTHNNVGWGPSPPNGFAGFLTSETVWIQMWVELPSAAKRAAYEDFLRSYVLEQKKIGRFPRPVDNRLTPVMAWIQEMGVVPREAGTLVVVSLLFLIVSALNLSGLLLGKFLARSPEIGVRRALGATRGDIFLQHIVECEIVAVLGGLVGIALSVIGLAAVAKLFQSGEVFHLDPSMILAAVGLSLVAGLIAGVYPAWRICATQPAVHLKLQ